VCKISAIDKIKKHCKEKGRLYIKSIVCAPTINYKWLPKKEENFMFFKKTLRKFICLVVLMVMVSMVMGTQVFAYDTTFTVDAGSSGTAFKIIGNNYSQGYENASRMDEWFKTLSNRVKDNKIKFVRIDGIFDNHGAMRCVTKDGDTLIYDWSVLDQMIDRILAEGAKPFLNISYQPYGILQSDFDDIIQAMIDHFYIKYSTDDVKYFEVWNEPNACIEQSLYLSRYNTFSTIIKAKDAAYKIGGPTVARLEMVAPDNWMEVFIDYVVANSLPLDFVTWHRYSQSTGSPISIYTTDIVNLNSLLEGTNLSPEIYMSEYNYNGGNDRNNDTNFDASYVMEVLNLVKDTNITGMFLFELKDGKNPARFWGRWGSFTRDDYPKPVYNSYKMYCNMPTTTKLSFATTTPVTGLNCFASKDGSRVEVMVWNHNSTSKSVSITLNNLPFGTSQIQYYRQLVDASNGNAMASLGNCELRNIDSQVMSAGSSKVINLTLGSYGVTKLVFKAVSTSVPTAPTGITATGDFRKIAVRWNAVTDINSYTISRSTTSGGTYTDVATGVNGTIFLDTTGAAGQYYYYKVKAVNNTGSSSSVASNGAMWNANPNDMNLAYAKDVIAKSTTNNLLLGTTKLVDGLRNSVTSSIGYSTLTSFADDEHTEQIIIDLGDIRKIDKIILYPRNDTGNVGAGFPVDFTIDLCDTAFSQRSDLTWNRVVTQTSYPNPGGNAKTFTFPLQSARTIKLIATKLSGIPAEGGYYRLQLAELEVYRTDVNSGLAGFSTTQGTNNWRYQQRSAGVFTDLTYNTTNGYWTDTDGCIVGKDYQIPGTSHDSVRTWVAPTAGTVDITGRLGCLETGANCDGVDFVICKNGVVLQTGHLIQNVGAGAIISLSQTVAIGDKIQFIIKKLTNNEADRVEWNPDIQYQ
jgi:beta-xylosidase